MKKEKDILQNTSKIKYVTIDNKLYQVKAISFYHMSVILVPSNQLVDGVPQDEIFPLKVLGKDFKIRIEN